MLRRVLDITAASILLLLTLPLLALASLSVLLFLGRPVLFRQSRAGLHGRPFTLFKLRTMLLPSQVSPGCHSDDPRLTAFGRFLRATSLDELPKLINVLRGDMSLVGPRPLHLHYLALYSPVQMRRHEVRPGITGWAQINGRNSLSWEAKFSLDVWYVDNRSLPLDLRILVLTVLRVLSRNGISQPGAATATDFNGSTNNQA
jgi:sugar transferase EpsL